MSSSRRTNPFNMALAALFAMACIFSVVMFTFSASATNRAYKYQQQVELGIRIPNPMPRTQPSLPNVELEESTTSSVSSPRHQIGDVVSRILQGSADKDFGTKDAGYLKLHDSPKKLLQFSPGTLSLNHSETLRHCWTETEVYFNHLKQGNRGDGSNVPVSYSDQYKLAYVMLPKSGSSTARHMLKEEFNAIETKKSLLHSSFEQGGEMEGVTVISFVRDPLSRFFSQYDEAYVRTAPWQSKSTSHPFPYLHEGLHSYQDYEDVFCPPDTRRSRKDCVFRQSKENGTLASRLERFVFDYDGLDPFDVHLTLQVPMLSFHTGLPLHITQIYNTTDSQGGWNAIAKQFLGKTLEDKGGKKGGVIAGRSYPRRFNSKLVSVEAQRRICELSLLDYCCLNIPLPDVCKGAHYTGDDGEKRDLFCTLNSNRYIQPGILPNNTLT
mmetsp:Transcript_27287/g.54676  ORF Transcript_27287/g.54676 Transcript_27287/m.54676 type:complete len:439 (-) Transcript_27287:2657-3973(-)